MKRERLENGIWRSGIETRSVKRQMQPRGQEGEHRVRSQQTERAGVLWNTSGEDEEISGIGQAALQASGAHDRAAVRTGVPVLRGTRWWHMNTRDC
jgi:hypothetical protein